MTTRATLHELVDSLPEDLLVEASDRLGSLAGDRELAETIRKRLDEAPADDEALSPREIDALRRYDAGERNGRMYADGELEALIQSRSSG